MLATLTIFGWIRFAISWIILLWGIREFVIEYYRYKCKKAYLRGEIDSIEKAANKVLKIRPNDCPGLAYKGLFYNYKGQYGKVQKIGEKILGIANKKKNERWQIYALNFLSNFYCEYGDLGKAEHAVNEALNIAKKSNIKKETSRIYNSFGLIYMKREEWENAEKMFDKAIKSFSEKDIRELAKIYCNFGINCRLCGDLVKSEEMLNEALEINEKYNLLGQLAVNYAEIATVCVLKGEIEKGQELYEKSLAISESKGMIKQSATQYCNLGLLYRKMGSREKAKEYWLKAKCLYEKMELTREVEKIQQKIDDSEFE